VSRRRGGDDHRSDDAVNSPLEDTVGNRRTLVGDTPYSVGYRPILLKNSFSTDREKISAVIGCDARFKLGGYVENAMPRCKAS